ncbi:MAG: hypothetical protein ACRYFW_00110 [Janthinobacterium lividum]
MMTPSGTGFRQALAIVAFLIAAVVPIKEVAFGLAIVLLLVFQPLNLQQVRMVLVQNWPIVVMIIVSLVMTLIDITDEMDSRSFIRIAFYYLRIPAFLLLGFGARRLLINERALLWSIVIVGAWGAGQTVYRYAAAGNISGLDHYSVREIIGTGDTTSILIPLCALILWRETKLSILKVALVAATIVTFLSIVAASSRTGIELILVTAILSLPWVRPLVFARWGGVVALIVTLLITTPLLLPILNLIGVDPLSINGLAEVIARPRTDLQSINLEWRGYETYMAFTAATKDGIIPLLFGHGMSAYAQLGVLIQLSPDELFDKADVFHNGWSFIVFHSGILGIGMYIVQFYLFAKPPTTSGAVSLRSENRLFALTVLSLAVSTATVAGIFNPGTFASGQLFLLGCFYPFSLVPVRVLNRLKSQSLAVRNAGGSQPLHG